MLALTENATAVIRSLISRRELPDDAGLRIAAADGSESFAVSTAGMPEDGDQIIDDGGARVFVEPQAAAMLEDKVLDARVDGEGRAHFVLAVQ